MSKTEKEKHGGALASSNLHGSSLPGIGSHGQDNLVVSGGLMSKAWNAIRGATGTPIQKSRREVKLRLNLTLLDVLTSTRSRLPLQFDINWETENRYYTNFSVVSFSNFRSLRDLDSWRLTGTGEIRGPCWLRRESRSASRG